MSVRYSVVVPVYNEEAVLLACYARLTNVMQSLMQDYELIFVDDGSRDESGEILAKLCAQDHHVRLVTFSRNFGHQAAISAGMDLSSGQAVIIIDADLQDPPEVIPEMIKQWKAGYDVVYGQREKRKGEGLFKKTTAKLFYRFLSSQTDVEIPLDTGDFRLIDRKVCDVLSSLTEKNRYVRGLVSFAGFRQIGVSYVREERYAGETKYPLRKMLSFAADATTSFSKKPLKLAGYVGFFLSLASFVYLFIT
ncbi:MAG: glycosyltransferase family 2 protein, partial [Oscillospiraceae bacterium]|nr:glycosyltransferase family 2 protein [Oscillospiraceae bacterium]